MNCSLLRSHDNWIAGMEMDGERLHANGSTPTEAMQNLELRVLGFPPVYVVHMDIVLESGHGSEEQEAGTADSEATGTCLTLAGS